ncbi:MAG: DNA mismatch repair endonuclease MutL [Flavobacteriaceae bacterium]|nr:DNA mismatch repair endonuclease MutL [Flavobacteriaceae bacterium]
MEDVIALLPDHVANQIAAGEVVQRPASVVKELLENAIDAQATRIQLIIKEAGKQLIQVVDNGLGMSPTDARLAFERHATSKIKQSDDLFALHTKGFRGEALASIAAVAQVEMHTKRSEDELATKIKIGGGEIKKQDLVVAPVGTSMSVSNLFFNVPARRNFLKSNAVELRHIIDEFHRVSIAHPEITFSMLQGGTELFDLPAGNLRRRLTHIFGSKLDDKLVPVEEQTTVSGIRGFVLKPEAAKRSRGMQFFFVNNRFVKSSFLHHAIMTAYDGLLHEGCYPGYFLFFELEPHTIDINIHPTKTEVKFENEQSLFAILRSAVKHSLGMFQVAPTLDFDRDPNLDVSYDQVDHKVEPPKIEVDRDFNPFQEKATHSFSSKISPQWESLYQEIGSTDSAEMSLIGALDSNPSDATQKIFQLMNRYLVSSTGAALLLIDQERAHERVLYELFLSNITHASTSSQQLLFPIKIELNSLQKAFYNDYASLLTEVGFCLGELKEDHVEVVGIPSVCSENKAVRVFEDLFESLSNEQPEDTFSQTDLVAKSMARTLSIKRGKRLETEEQQQLINDLFACKETQLSPYNRQIFVSLTKEELEKKFN